MKECTGTPDYDKYPDFFCLQYWNKDVKALDGESQREVNRRMTEAFWEVVENNRNKKERDKLNCRTTAF